MSIGPTINAINYFGELDAGQSFAATSVKYTRWNLGCVLEKRVTSTSYSQNGNKLGKNRR